MGGEMTDSRPDSDDASATAAPGLFGFEGKSASDGTPLSELPDLRNLSPHLEPYLLPFQRVIYVHDLRPLLGSSPKPMPHPSSSKALLDLMRVHRLSDIGKHGPGNAALPLPEHRDLPEFTLLDGLFGRDALYMGINLYESFPELLRATLYRLAELQGVKYNSANEEEPGRIIHWAPDPHDPVAEHISAVNGWEWPHYGAIDSTPLFIRGILRVLKDDPSFLKIRYVGVDRQEHDLSHAFHAAIAWLETRLQSNSEGLLEFRMSQPRGIWNQAWKDTPESYVHSDGTYANHTQGIASIEVQALAYDTLVDLAQYYAGELKRQKNSPTGTDLQTKLELLSARARQLKDRVLDTFWLEDARGAYFALATDRDQAGRPRPLAVRTSNMGHALHLLDDDDPEVVRRQAALIETLFSEELLDRNGIRTLSSRETRFVPFSYHCGSVWPWDNEAIAKELRKVGYPALAHDLERRVWRVADTLGFFIEFVPGNNAVTPSELVITSVVDVYDGEREHFSNCYRIEKPGQEVQAWTVEAIRTIKRGNQPLRRGSSLQGAPDPAKRELESRLLSRT
jgi:Mannosylglycerate hydrolase MGH1-like glycoside hydrolase domain